MSSFEKGFLKGLIIGFIVAMFGSSFVFMIAMNDRIQIM